MSTGCRFAGVFLALCLFSGPTFAGSVDPDLPKPDAKGRWRVIGQDDATTTSKCIGQLMTPLCAMETYLASSVRSDFKLFNESSILLPGEEEDVLSPTSDTVKYSTSHRVELKYRILSSEILTKKKIPPPFISCHVPDHKNCKEIPSAWQPGDVRILITSRECRDGECSHKEGSARGAVLRLIGGEWKIVLMRRGITRVERVDGKGDWRE